MKRIGILYVCTGRYTLFWQHFYKSAEQYLFSDSGQYEKHYFVFTDCVSAIQQTDRVHVIPIPKEPWPYPTLKRWHYFLQAENIWSRSKVDYLYHFNAGISFLDFVADDILPESDKPLVFTLHVRYPPTHPNSKYTYDRNPASCAFVKKGTGRFYFWGALSGGKIADYTSLCREMKERTDRDLANGVIALRHDESHMNRYAIDYPEKITVLPHTTIWAESPSSPYSSYQSSRIMCFDKSQPRWGGYAWLRGTVPSQITVKLTGGLGNQIYQYAAALALYSRHVEDAQVPDIKLYKSWYPKFGRPFLLGKLFPKVKARKRIPYKVHSNYPKYCVPEAGSFNESFLDVPPAVILNGYFQHYRYWEIAKEYLKPQLAPMPSKYKELQQNHQLVAVHVRRSNYVDLHAFHGMVPLVYYQCALRKIQERITSPYLLVFGDDLPWVQHHLEAYFEQLGLPYSIPDGDTLDDFSLMAQCQHFILSNSSFSSSAALFGANKDSLVFMPKMWIVNQNILSKQIMPPHWQVPSYSFYTKGKSKNPLISVIIPVHDTRPYLDRCFESVCLQTEQNFEIIIVDDVSPDNSWELISDYATRDQRIVAIRHTKNLYVGGARNSGIKVARGQYLLLLDSDDYIRLDTIETFASYTQKYTTTKLFVCNVFRVREGSGKLIPYMHQVFSDTRVDKPFEHYCLCKSPTLMHTAWGRLYHKSLFDNSLFHENLVLVEDCTLAPKLFAKLDSLLLIPQTLMYYQQRQDSLSASLTPKRERAFCQFMHILYSWSNTLAAPEQNMIRERVLLELDGWVQSTRYIEPKEKAIERLQSLLHNTSPFLGEYMFWLSKTHRSGLWYQLGEHLQKRQFLMIGVVLTKKIGLYRFARPFAMLVNRAFIRIRLIINY